MVLASHLLPGSGAVDKLTVSPFTQRYTVRACASLLQASAMTATMLAAWRRMKGYFTP